MSTHVCIDCRRLPERLADLSPGEEILYGPEFRPARPRPAPHGGPRSRRCTTHHRARQAASRARAHATYVAKTYGLAPGEYDALLAFQGGACAICQCATGKARRLAVDHDHDTGEVRGLLCTSCNRTVLSHGGSVLRSAVAYLNSPPAARMRAARLKEIA